MEYEIRLVISFLSKKEAACIISEPCATIVRRRFVPDNESRSHLYQNVCGWKTK